MNARDEILARIQRSFPIAPRSSTEDYTAIPRDYTRSGQLDPEARLELFEERLRDYGAEVFRCAPAQLPETIALAMRSARVSRVIAPENIFSEWLPTDGFFFVRDSSLSYAELDACEGILTTCVGAIALTGTIILRHARDGRRVITLIPDYHLCLVRATQVVETVSEAIRAIESPAASPLTTISGPSATSDIEMTRIQGVHGPRRLHVILIQA